MADPWQWILAKHFLEDKPQEEGVQESLSPIDFITPGMVTAPIKSVVEVAPRIVGNEVGALTLSERAALKQAAKSYSEKAEQMSEIVPRSLYDDISEWIRTGDPQARKNLSEFLENNDTLRKLQARRIYRDSPYSPEEGMVPVFRGMSSKDPERTLIERLSYQPTSFSLSPEKAAGFARSNDNIVKGWIDPRKGGLIYPRALIGKKPVDTLSSLGQLEKEVILPREYPLDFLEKHTHTPFEELPVPDAKDLNTAITERGSAFFPANKKLMEYKYPGNDFLKKTLQDRQRAINPYYDLDAALREEARLRGYQ